MHVLVVKGSSSCVSSVRESEKRRSLALFGTVDKRVFAAFVKVKPTFMVNVLAAIHLRDHTAVTRCPRAAATVLPLLSSLGSTHLRFGSFLACTALYILEISATL